MTKSFVGESLGGFVYVNPGTGPVENSSEDEAFNNMKVFCSEIGANVKWLRTSVKSHDGRFEFSIWPKGNENEAILIDMPGLPLEEVRYLGNENQNIWDFPRLYVEGSSWVWKYAIPSAKELLFGTEEEE